MAPLTTIGAGICLPGQLDRVLAASILPAQRRLLDLYGEVARFWYFRYARRGQQWKLRLQVPRDLVAEGRQHLASLFADTGQPLDQEPPHLAIYDRLQSVDAEDSGQGLRPERGFYWTTPIVSPVCFGPDQLLLDDRYLAAIGEAHAACSRRLANSSATALTPDWDGRGRMSLFMSWAAEILGHSSLTDSDLFAYVLFHRDTILRHLLAAIDAGEDAQSRLAEKLQSHALRSQDAIFAAAQALSSWRSGSSPRDPVFEQTITRLLAIVREPDRPWSGLQLDIFCRRNDFLPLFKLVNLAANVLGLTKLNEAAILHMLACALGLETSERVRFEITPTFDASLVEAGLQV